MNNKAFRDKDLDHLLGTTVAAIEDNGFSTGVVKRLKRRGILTAMIPTLSGIFGGLITITMLPEGRLSSVMLRLIDPIPVALNTHSSEILLFLTSYGIEPSLFWLFLGVPLFILPIALHQD